MRIRSVVTIGLLSLLILVGCEVVVEDTAGPAQPSGETSMGASSVSSDGDGGDAMEDVVETRNVMYIGTVEPAGISIYQEGTHRLTLPGGKFILLESENADLNGYVGEKVEIYGALRPTVEAGGTIMRVERIFLREDDDDEEMEDEEEQEGGDEEEIEEIEDGDTSDEAKDSESKSSYSSADSEDSPAVTVSAPFAARIEAMASQDFSVPNWTQQYCTAHIGFCIPVHRNWWFKSFGTTTTAIWHVEMNSEEIAKLGDGPIVINLLSGAAGESDGTVTVKDGKTIGIRVWSDSRHFEISADASLEAAIRYITEHLVDFDG